MKTLTLAALSLAALALFAPAEGIDSTAPMIRASFRPMRGLLIRPRTSFVPELLSTADDL